MSSNFFLYSDLEFDPLYSEIDFAISRLDSNNDPLEEISSDIISWSLINDQCEKLLEKGFNWRVLLWQLRAKLMLQGISALWITLQILEQALEQLPAESEVRRDAATGLIWLAGNQCFTLFKNAQLTPGMTLSLERCQVRESNEDRSSLPYPEIISAVETADRWYREQHIPALHSQLIDCQRMLNYISENVNFSSDGYQFNATNLSSYLLSAQKNLSGLSANPASNSDEELNTHVEPYLPASEQQIPDIPQNRREVIIMLDHILTYFEQYEPSHPAPVFIRRSKKMIGMDFMAIVEEMLPDALSTLQQFAGKS